MTEITAALVKELREATQAPMMDCKRALVETGGDIEAAKIILRERGLAAAGKRADRATTEGVVGVRLEDGIGAIAGLGCETEPVSRNDEFRSFAKRVLDAVFADGADATERFEVERQELVGKLGENLAIINPARLEGGTLSSYVHPPANKIGVLVQLDGGTAELARQLAMHISFGKPEWLDRDGVPAETVAAERQIFANSDEVQSKPEQAREKIVEGMLAKRFFAAAPGGVLLDQAWIHDQSKSVAKVMDEAGASVKAFRLIAIASS